MKLKMALGRSPTYFTPQAFGEGDILYTLSASLCVYMIHLGVDLRADGSILFQFL